MSKSSKSFFAYLLGIITGGIIGILYAPENGKNTRDKLTYKLDKARKKLEELVENISEGKVDIQNEAKDKGKEIVDEAKQKAEQLLDDVNSLIDQIKK